MMMVGGAPTFVRKTAIILLALVVASFSYAQTLYKYRGENGEWIYTDRKPVEKKLVEVRELESTFVEPEFSVTHEVIGSSIEFVAHNEFYAPVEVRLKFVEITGVQYPESDQMPCLSSRAD